MCQLTVDIYLFQLTVDTPISIGSKHLCVSVDSRYCSVSVEGPPQTTHTEFSGIQTRASAMIGLRLTAIATERSFGRLKFISITYKLQLYLTKNKLHVTQKRPLI